MRGEVIKRRAESALCQVMEPGDQIIAGALAVTGPSVLWDLLLALPALAGAVAGAANLFGGFSPPQLLGPVLVFVPFLIAWPLHFWHRPVFVAVTHREFICYRMSRLGNEPSRLLFRAPLAASRMRIVGGRMPNWAAVRYCGPGADGRGLRLNVKGRRWRRDLNEILAALQVGGAAVDGTLTGRPALQPGS